MRFSPKIIVLLDLTFSFCLGYTAQAFTLQPPIVETVVDPGSNQTVFVRVSNDENVDKAYLFTVQKFIPKGEQGQQEFLPPEEVSGLPEWMFFDRVSLALKAGESFNFPIGLRIPKDAQPGSYYAALFFSEQPVGIAPGQTVATVARTGVLFLITVNGDAKPKLNIEEFISEGDSFTSLPVNFVTRVTNSGGAHVAPQGEIVIKNILGLTVGRLDVNPEIGRVLPGSTRVFNQKWGEESTIGQTYIGKLINQVLNFAIGPHVASLELRGLGSEETAVVSTKFSVWPTELMIVLAAIAVLAVIFLMVFRKFVIHRATRD